jgi:hypothetical protein
MYWGSVDDKLMWATMGELTEVLQSRRAPDGRAKEPRFSASDKSN